MAFFHFAGANGDNFTLVGFLFGRVGDDDSTLRGFFLFQSANQDTVMQGSYIHSHFLDLRSIPSRTRTRNPW
jgi:hypothetical protein